jgi:hypothetical protein
MNGYWLSNFVTNNEEEGGMGIKRGGKTGQTKLRTFFKTRGVLNQIFILIN